MYQTPVSTRTVTLVLAYLEHYNCKFVSGRCLPVLDLRRLAEWIGVPAPQMRSVRTHQPLAAHLALLAAADLLSHDSGYWRCSPSLYAWLQATTVEQYAWLLRPFVAKNLWQAAVQQLGLQETLAIDYAAFVRQHLARQSRRPGSAERGYAAWLAMTEETWQLSLPITLPLPALFHLLQLGQWQPDEPLRCTPLTIATAAQRGFSLTRMEMIFMDATGQSLAEGQMQQLLDWYERRATYRIDAVYLLSARQPHQLAQILADGRLRRRVHRQISPRHALVSPAISGALRRWLAKRNFPLASTTGKTSAKSRDLPDAAFTWLGLRLLVELAGLIELPFHPPHHSLEQVESRLTPHEMTGLEQQVLSIVDSLRAAIRGRDAFFPSRTEPPHELIEQIQQAMAAEQWLDIAYQSLVDRRPYWRRVYPLRLEVRGRLHYLHAYCSQAEADRIFRLDRITEYSFTRATSE